jgi:hypothetical protein
MSSLAPSRDLTVQARIVKLILGTRSNKVIVYKTVFFGENMVL